MSSTLTHLGLSLKNIDYAMHWNNQTQALAQQSQSPSLGAVAQFDLLRIEFYLGHIGRCKEIAEQATAQLMQSPEGVDQVPFFFSSRRRHTRWTGDWSSDVCSSD